MQTSNIRPNGTSVRLPISRQSTEASQEASSAQNVTDEVGKIANAPPPLFPRRTVLPSLVQRQVAHTTGVTLASQESTTASIPNQAGKVAHISIVDLVKTFEPTAAALQVKQQLMLRPERERDSSLEHWVLEYRQQVNANNLLSAQGKLTRYGVINIGDYTFIVGPRPDEQFGETESLYQQHIYQRLINQYSQIGRIFGVDPDLDRPLSQQSQLAAISSRGYKTTAHYTRMDEMHNILPRDSAGVEYQEFTGFDVNHAPAAEAYWQAGRGIAQFIQDNPGKIPMICSERGLSRPCAVAASAVMQLQEKELAQVQRDHPAVWDQMVLQLERSLEIQRSPYSSSHISLGHEALSANLNRLSLVDSVRTRGIWTHQMADITPAVLPQIHFLEGRAIVFQDEMGQILHRYSANNEQHGIHAREAADPNDIYLYHVAIYDGKAIDADTRQALAVQGEILEPNHYEVGNAHGTPWNRRVIVNPDGDCLYRALHRALPSSLQRGDSEESAIQRYRNEMADYLANHVDILDQFTVRDMSHTWTSDSLGSIHMQDIKFTSRGYTTGVGEEEQHIDRITLEPVQPTDPTVVRLITRNTLGQYNCDNKFFQNSSIAGLYGSKVSSREANQTIHPSSREPVVGYINYQGEIQDIELLLGTANYRVGFTASPEIQGAGFHLPVLSVANREISMMTDSQGRIIGGPAHGATVKLDSMPISHAIFFSPIKSPGSAKQSLMCYSNTDGGTAHAIKYIDPNIVPNLNSYSQRTGLYGAIPEKGEQLNNPNLAAYPPKVNLPESARAVAIQPAPNRGAEHANVILSIERLEVHQPRRLAHRRAALPPPSALSSASARSSHQTWISAGDMRQLQAEFSFVAQQERPVSEQPAAQDAQPQRHIAPPSTHAPTARSGAIPKIRPLFPASIIQAAPQPSSFKKVTKKFDPLIANIRSLMKRGSESLQARSTLNSETITLTGMRHIDFLSSAVATPSAHSATPTSSSLIHEKKALLQLHQRQARLQHEVRQLQETQNRQRLAEQQQRQPQRETEVASRSVAQPQQRVQTRPPTEESATLKARKKEPPQMG